MSFKIHIVIHDLDDLGVPRPFGASKTVTTPPSYPSGFLQIFQAWTAVLGHGGGAKCQVTAAGGGGQVDVFGAIGDARFLWCENRE